MRVSWCSSIMALSSGLHFLLSLLLLSSYLWFSKFFNSSQIKPHGSVFPKDWSPIPHTALGNGLFFWPESCFQLGSAIRWGCYFDILFFCTQGCPQHSSLGSPPFHKSVPSLEGLDYNETLSLFSIIFFLKPSIP